MVAVLSLVAYAVIGSLLPVEAVDQIVTLQPEVEFLA